VLATLLSEARVARIAFHRKAEKESVTNSCCMIFFYISVSNFDLTKEEEYRRGLKPQQAGAFTLN
jgi:hypothetical protein